MRKQLTELRGIVDQALFGKPSPPTNEREVRERFDILGELFKAYGSVDKIQVDVYFRETLEIPLDKLQAAITALHRSHAWPRVPLISELWSAARYIAGMHREQYVAGHYLPAPLNWPPLGMRHAIEPQAFEPIIRLLRIDSPEDLQLAFEPERISLSEGASQ